MEQYSGACRSIRCLLPNEDIFVGPLYGQQSVTPQQTIFLGRRLVSAVSFELDKLLPAIRGLMLVTKSIVLFL